MEGKKTIELNCALCAKIGACDHTGPTGVCSEFCPDAKAIADAVNEKTEGLTWEDAKKAAQLKGKCIRRKAWGKEPFVWWRDNVDLTSDTNDPYLREAFRRSGYSRMPEARCFAYLDYDSRMKGLPRIILGWRPTDEGIKATDWETFDAPVTYEDRKVEAKFLSDILRNYRGDGPRACYNLLKGIFPEKVKGHEEEIASKVKCAFRRRMGLKRNFESIFGKMDEINGIMDDLDDLLK
jgi:hypothetical protein